VSFALCKFLQIVNSLTCGLSSFPDAEEVLKSVPPLGEAGETKRMIPMTPEAISVKMFHQSVEQLGIKQWWKRSSSSGMLLALRRIGERVQQPEKRNFSRHSLPLWEVSRAGALLALGANPPHISRAQEEQSVIYFTLFL